MTRSKFIVAAPWLARLARLLAPRDEALSADDVHLLRVACGRLRVFLRLGGGGAPGLERRLRALRERAGAIRDLDVHLERVPPRHLARALGRRRAREAKKLRRAIAGGDFDSLLADLSELPAVARARARSEVTALVADVTRRGRDLARAPDDMRVLHHLRRSVRRLRYALEWLGDEARAQALEDLQAGLGAVWDRVVALDEVRAAGPRGKKQRAYAARLAIELEAHRREAVASSRALVRRFAAVRRPAAKIQTRARRGARLTARHGTARARRGSFTPRRGSGTDRSRRG